MAQTAQEVQEQTLEIIGQQNRQRCIRAMTVGMMLLKNETVSAPISYAEGLADLTWMLDNLLSGQFGINFNPTGQVPTLVQPEKDPPSGGNGAGDEK